MKKTPPPLLTVPVNETKPRLEAHRTRGPHADLGDEIWNHAPFYATPASLPGKWWRRGAVLALLLIAIGGIGGFILAQSTSIPSKEAAPVAPAAPATPAPVAEAAAPAERAPHGSIAMQPSSDPAILKLQKAAAGGDLKAQYTLAERYDAGKGVPLDKKLAQDLLTNAAAGGYAPAMFALGNAYATGRYSDPDRRAAARWLEAAAMTGHAQAAFNLGVLYEAGIDGAPDLGLALGWFQRAASFGSNEALAAIARLTPKRAPITEDDIREIQTALKAQGFDPGPPNGKISRRTSDAIRAYQAQIGLMEDGRPSHFLLDRLTEKGN